jgi:hypothetical protein
MAKPPCGRPAQPRRDDPLAELLTALRQARAAGASFDEAFASTAGDSPEGFARAYFRREAIWNAWVPFLTSATALWMGITLLALLAIRRRRERDASLRAIWAAEEAARHVEALPNPEDDSRRWN